MRVAVVVKQVPRFEQLDLGPDGRLRRDGVELEMNPYCRRAVSKGVELARASGGTCTVFTLGPPAAEDCLREAVAWGADEGVLITDRAFAGSDTLATSRALAAALEREGPFELVLAGRNSVDADTGQVGPEVAELLGLPFLAGVKVLEVLGTTLRATCEHDDGRVEAEVELPALISCAERLCEPAKVDPEGRAGVAPGRIRVLAAAELGQGPWGQDGSPTRVGDVRLLDVQRRQVVLEGPVDDQVRAAVALLDDAGAFGHTGGTAAHGHDQDPVPDGWERGDQVVAVLLEPGRPRVGRELLGGAARLAAGIGGTVLAVQSPGRGGKLPPEAATLASWGADQVLEMSGSAVVEDTSAALAGWCRQAGPWAVLAPGTMWGREMASRLAARLGAGLTGDAVDLDVEGGRLVGWKPAFGGRLVAAITATSPVQLATVRPGILPLLAPRPPVAPAWRRLEAEPRSRVRVLKSVRDDELDMLASAEVVVGVGTGVPPEDYPALTPLLEALGAELAATRKVTDRGWQPRARQVGITGRSISPRLYVAIGLSGKFNHVVGVRGAGQVLAINADSSALIFGSADVGIVADWRDVVPILVSVLGERVVATT